MKRRIADWPKLFGYVITATGWTRREVESLTLFDLNELLGYWSEHPPAHVLLGAVMQARGVRRRQSSSDLLGAVAAAGGKITSKPSRSMASMLGDTRINEPPPASGRGSAVR